MRSLKNISVSEMRLILKLFGFVLARTKGGHETWKKTGMIGRPVVIQSHVEPIPEFIVKNAITAIGVSRQEFIDALESI